jgi:hypothetical protein
LFVSGSSTSPDGSVPAARGGEFTGLGWRLRPASGGELNRPQVANSPARAELLSETGAERSIIDGATNLKQQIGAASRPAHLLGFIHPAVHQEIGRSFGERGSDAPARRCRSA